MNYKHPILLLLAVFLQLVVFSQNSVNTIAEVSAGTYTPMYNDSSNKTIEVSAFNIDVTAVTNEQFLAFVKANPNWQKSKVKRIYADESYLFHWESDTIIGNSIVKNAPVVYVSWFAAKAYSKWIGRALPTVDQWEYVAQAAKDNPYGNSPEFKNELLRLYEQKHDIYKTSVGQNEPNYWGVYDMHGFIWEWTIDFNSILISGESRKDNSLDRNLFCAAGSLGTVDPVNYAAFLRYSYRGSLKANYCLKGLGFRTVNIKE